MRVREKLVLIGLVLFASFFLSSYVYGSTTPTPTPEPSVTLTPEPQLMNEKFLRDSSLIDGDPCAPPCWHNITPGETTWIEARTQLMEDDALANIQINEQEDGDRIAVTFEQKGGIPCCLIYSEDGEIIAQILLQLDSTINLDQIIELYGEPIYLSFHEVSPSQAAAALYYPELQTVIYAFIPGAETGELEPESPIFAALYMRTPDMEFVIQGSSLYPWAGYLPYRDYVRIAIVTPVTPTATPD